MEVKGSNLDFALVVGSALRYGLGRRTYITGAISKFIIENIKLIPNDQKLVMIRDIKDKEYYGDDCDKENWRKLLAELEKSIENGN